MKMGNTLSPWRYDLVAGRSLQSAKLRWRWIQHYAFWISPNADWVSVTASEAAIPVRLTDKREELEAVVCRAPWVRVVNASLPHITSRALGADDLLSSGIIEIRRFNAFLGYQLNTIMGDLDTNRRFAVLAGIKHY